MCKLKITLLIVAGLLAVLLSIPAYLLLTFDDRDYQQLLVNSVAKFSDFTLSINGQFKLQRSWSPVLTASDIKLQSKINTNNITLDNFSIRIDLRRLPGGTLLIKSLVMKNMDCDISAGLADSIVDTLGIIRYLPAPVIEHAELTKIHLQTSASNNINLTRLTIAANDEQYPLGIDGYGKFNADAFTILGQFGPLADIFENSPPYPVQLKIDSHHTSLDLTGTIEEPSQGEGLNLLLTLEARELSDMLDQKAPQLGHLSAQGRLVGSFDKPALKHIKVLLAKQRSVSIQATGSIDNLLTQEDMNVQISGFIHDTHLLRWLLPNNSPAVNKLDFNAKLANDRQDLILDKIDLKLKTAKGIEVTLQGSTHIGDAQLPLRDMFIKAIVKSPNTEAVNPYLGNFLPELGAVQGTTTITSSEQGYMLTEIDILAGQGQKIQLNARGNAGPFLTAAPELNMALDLLLSAKQTADLGTVLDTELPAIGPINIKSHLTGTPEKIKLGEIKFRAGSPNLVIFHGDGEISWDLYDKKQPLQHTDITFFSSAPSSRDAYRLIGDDMPDLGPYEASMRVHGTGNVLTGSNVRIETGTKDTLFIDVQGNIEKIFLTDFRQKGIDLSGTISAKSTHQLSRLDENLDIPDFGTVKGQINIQGDSKNLSIPRLSLIAGRKHGLLISAKGTIQNIPLKNNAFPHGIKINLDASSPSTTELFVFLNTGTKVPDFGQLKISGLLEENQGLLALNKLIITAGNPDQPDINMYGTVKNVFDRQGLEVRVLFNETLLTRLFNLKHLDRLGPIRGSLLLSNTDDSLGIEELKIESKKSEILSLNIKGKIDDVVQLDEINMNADVTIYDLVLAGKLFDLDLPKLDEIRISGHLRGAKDKTAFKGNVIIGKTRLLSDLSIAYKQGIPSITGKISSNDINLPDLGFTQEERSTEQRRAEPLFSKKPMPLDLLNKVNLDLKITTDKVTGITYPLEKTTIDMTLHSGKLKIAPAKFIMSGGQVLLNADISSDSTRESSLTIRSKDLKLGTLLQQSQSKPPIEGDLDMVINLTGKGRSAHEIASSLNGDVALLLENGKIRKRKFDIIFLNMFDWLFSYGITDNEMIISCGLANLKIVNGIASNMLFIDGPKLTARGKGTINLNKETIDALVNMEKKKLFFNDHVPIHLSGSLLDPDVKVVSLTQQILQAGGYIFAPAVTIPIEILGTLWDLVDNEKKEGGACHKQILH